MRARCVTHFVCATFARRRICKARFNKTKTCVRCMMRKYGELLNDVAMRLRTANTTGQLQQILIDVAAALRFKYFWCGPHQGAGRAFCDCEAIHNFPASLIVGHERIASAGLLPMQLYSESRSGGFSWDDEDFLRWLSARQKADLHEARRRGLTHGYTFPISHAVGAAASCSFVTLDDEIDRPALDLAHILIPTIYARFLLLTRDQMRKGKGGRLSRRERDCLCLKARGVADSDIAAILGISIHTVARHLGGAKERLSANTREHAIAIALKSGQIT